jgi:hypothetical protein
MTESMGLETDLKRRRVLTGSLERISMTMSLLKEEQMLAAMVLELEPVGTIAQGKNIGRARGLGFYNREAGLKTGFYYILMILLTNLRDLELSFFFLIKNKFYSNIFPFCWSLETRKIYI